MDQAYESAVRQLPPQIRDLLLRFPQDKQQTVREITMRAGKPLVLTTGEGIRFCGKKRGFYFVSAVCLRCGYGKRGCRLSAFSDGVFPAQL